LFDEAVGSYPAGTQYVDGIRDVALFEGDWLFEREGEFYRLPNYTSDERDTWLLFSKWNDSGGTGRIHMNATGWSGAFQHQALGHSGYYSGNMYRTRLEWLPMRVLARKACEALIATGKDNCEWINRIDPPDPS